MSHLITISVKSDRWEETIVIESDATNDKVTRYALAIWDEHRRSYNDTVAAEERARWEREERRARMRVVV